MQIKIAKTNPSAVIPSYAKAGDAGLDLTAISKTKLDNGIIMYGTGLCLEIPEGYCAKVHPRSSTSKTALFLSNSVGIIDSNYRGEIMIPYRRHNDTVDLPEYEIGDRVAQILIERVEPIEFIETTVEELSTTDRGVGGFGSTGK